jgi:hypothetical protein
MKTLPNLRQQRKSPLGYTFLAFFSSVSALLFLTFYQEINIGPEIKFNQTVDFFKPVLDHYYIRFSETKYIFS